MILSTNRYSLIPDTYAKTLCVFSFDEAKTFAEKQASRKSMDPLWGFLLQVSASVAQAEKQYLNLSFLAPRGFLRKEVLNGILT